MSTSPEVAAAPRALAIALPRWQRLAIYVATLALLLSGLCWIVAEWPVIRGGDAAELDPAARIVAAWSLRLHGIAAYALLIAAGAALPMHVRLAWLRRRNRGSGSGLLLLLASLALTALWLYYGPEAGRPSVSTFHWLVGLLLPAWLLVHRWRGLRSRAA